MMTCERRTFVAGLIAAAWPTTWWEARRGPHPEPRPGIDGSNVLPSNAITDRDVAKIFDHVRAIPEIVDGIRCSCGCASRPEKYSLLSCFEGDGMARHCGVCQGQAKLVYRLHRSHRSLDQIRTEIDAQWGS